MSNSHQNSPGQESLVYEPSKVSWATAQFIRRPPSIATRSFVYVVWGGLIIGLIYAHLSRVAISIETRGTLITEKSLFPIKAPANFKVARLLVQENKTVKKGQVMMESEEQLSVAEFDLIKKHTQWLTNFLAREKSGKCANCFKEMKNFSENAFRIQNRGQVRENLVPVQDLVRDFLTAKSQTNNFDSVTSSLQRQIKMAESKLKEIQRQRAENILGMQVEQLNNDITSAKAQIAERRQNIDGQVQQVLNKLDVRVAGLMATIELYRSQYNVIAPIDGIVSNLKVSGAGQLISGGQELLELIPLDSVLVAELQVANRDISKVKPNMRAKIKLDALPEREYGAVDGTVTIVPPNIAAKNEAQALDSYKVVVNLDRQSLTKGNAEHAFRLGMTLSGHIVTKYDSLLNIGVKKLLNIKDELFQD